MLGVLAKSAAAVRAQDAPEIDLTTWEIGDIDALPDDDYGRMVHYGLQLTAETSAVIGPEVADPAMRYAGNNLACTSCHQDNATKPYTMPWTGVRVVFPQYRARESTLQPVEDRVNGGMKRSMAGKPLPLDSPEMRGFTAYIHFLSRGIPVGATIKGGGVQAVAASDRPADPVAGKSVYHEHCALCHADDGLGIRNGEAGDAQGYLYPAVMGEDSYNGEGGRYRVLMADRFVLNTMSQGADHTARLLTKDQAYDVAAYLSLLPWGEKAGMENDFSDRLPRPRTCPLHPGPAISRPNSTDTARSSPSRTGRRPSLRRGKRAGIEVRPDQNHWPASIRPRSSNCCECH